MYQNVCPPRLSSAEGLGCLNLLFFSLFPKKETKKKKKIPGGKLKKKESLTKENICGI